MLTIRSANQTMFGVSAALFIVACYFLSALLLGFQVGPWEAVRESLVNGLLAFAWLFALHRILRNVSVPELPVIKRPRSELTLLLATLAGMIMWAAMRYAGQYNLPSWLYYLLFYTVVLGVFLGSGYGAGGLGLVWPPRRGWLAVAAVIGLNLLTAVIFLILPPGEAADLPAADMTQQISSPFSVLVLLFGLLIRGALPEELIFRIGIQPRLSRFMPVGWAIIVQALLFNAAHFPQEFLVYGRSFWLSIGYLLSIENGLMAGYLWYRTRSLPLLLLVHLFAFSRFGI